MRSGDAGGTVQPVANAVQMQQGTPIAFDVTAPSRHQASNIGLGDRAATDFGIGGKTRRLQAPASHREQNLAQLCTGRALGVRHGRPHALLHGIELDHGARLEAARGLLAKTQDLDITGAPVARRGHDQAHGLAGADVQQAEDLRGLPAQSVSGCHLRASKLIHSRSVGRPAGADSCAWLERGASRTMARPAARTSISARAKPVASTAAAWASASVSPSTGR